MIETALSGIVKELRRIMGKSTAFKTLDTEIQKRLDENPGNEEEIWEWIALVNTVLCDGGTKKKGLLPYAP